MESQTKEELTPEEIEERQYVVLKSELEGNFAGIINDFINPDGLYPEELTNAIAVSLTPLPIFVKNPDLYTKWAKEKNQEIKLSTLKGKKAEILALLEENDLGDKKYLDIGECSEGMYFGFILDGKEAIVTSKGNIYLNKQIKIKGIIDGENEIKNLIEYDGYIGEIAPIIAKETIKRYILKNSRNNLINPKEIYQTIRDKILYYMDFSGADEIADVLACWIIATYCYPLFYWFPHILINAPSTSGKTKCAFIIILMSFRGFDIGASGGVSPPQIFRTIEGNHGTILIDEFETAKGKESIEAQRLVNQLLNASASKDAYVIRPEQINGKWKAKKFPIFCPKIACNISGINPTSLSRLIAFSWLKTKSNKSKKKPTRAKDLITFKPIREDLHLLILEKGQEIKQIYDSLDIPSLSNREEDNWLPLFAIARFIDGCEGQDVKAEENLNKYLENYKEIQIETEDNTEDFFRILYDKIEGEKYYTPKEIGSWNEIVELYSYLKSPAHVVGKNLKSYKFKNNRGGGIQKYLLSKESIKKIIELYFDKNLIDTDTLTEESHKQHQTTQEKGKNVGLSGVCGVTIENNKQITIKFKTLESFEVVTFQKGRETPLTFEKDKIYYQEVLGDLQKEILEILLLDKKIKLEPEIIT